MIFELEQKQKDVIEKVKHKELVDQTEIAKYEEKLLVANEEKERYLKRI